MFKTLLLTVDINDPESAIRSTEVAVDMARQYGAVLHVLNVVPDQGMAIVSASMAADYGEAAMKSAQTEMQKWADKNIPEDISFELHVLRGKVYDQIIKTASRLQADCILVGAHSPALQDYLIGPNAARVARHAPQSVFVLR